MLPNYVVSTVFKNNESAGAIIYMFFAVTVFQGCHFVDNYAPNEVTSLTLAQGILYVSESTFENTVSFLETKYGP